MARWLLLLCIFLHGTRGLMVFDASSRTASNVSVAICIYGNMDIIRDPVYASHVENVFCHEQYADMFYAHTDFERTCREHIVAAEIKKAVMYDYVIYVRGGARFSRRIFETFFLQHVDKHIVFPANVECKQNLMFYRWPHIVETCEESMVENIDDGYLVYSRAQFFKPRRTMLYGKCMYSVHNASCYPNPCLSGYIVKRPRISAATY